MIEKTKREERGEKLKVTVTTKLLIDEERKFCFKIRV